MLPAVVGASTAALTGGSSFLGSIGGLSGLGNIISGVGGLFGGGDKKGPDAWNMLQYQYKHQRKIDENRPSWVVEGARRAGLHPLAALGMPAISSGGVSFGGSGDDSLGSRIERLGTGVSRAASVFQDRSTQALERVMAKLQVENAELQNARLRSEINLMNQPATPAPLALQNSALDGYVAPNDAAAVRAELRGDPEYWFDGRRYWSPSTLKQMESDFLRPPLEYLGRAGRDIENLRKRASDAVGRAIFGK